MGLAALWESAVGGPEINQWLHWLELMWLHHIQSGGGEDEVGEARVELFLEVEVVEWLDEVRPVEVSVDAEHLAEDGLADLEELLREARGLANPVVAGQGADWEVGVGWSRSDWSSSWRGARWVGA